VADGNADVADAGAQLATRSQQLVDAISTRKGDLATALLAKGFSQEQVDEVLAEAGRLSAPVSDANGTIQRTSGQLTALSKGAAEVASGNRKLADAAGPLTGGLHQAATGARSMRDGATSLAGGTRRLGTGAATLLDGQRSALEGAERLSDGATKIEDGLGRLGDGAGTLHDGLAKGLTSIPDPSASARKAVAQTIGSPVTVQSTSQATAGSYGAGLAPFFLSLALWIGAYVLFLLVKPLSTRALAAGQPGWRVAVGGWLAPALFGIGQAALVFAVVTYGLGIGARYPLGVVAMMMLASLTFVAILHALAARLGAVGKFLGLVFLVVQLVSAGGTFPWQTLPVPLHALHHTLPMGYAVDALRHLMYGGSLASVGRDAAVLAAYLAGALALTTLTARRARVWTPSRVKPELVL
jgi:putative membrane protein